MKTKHGIIKNSIDGKLEAWEEGKKIGAISLECEKRTIALWIKRYSNYLGVVVKL